MAYAIQSGEKEERPLTSLPTTLAHPHSREPHNRTYTTAYIEGEGVGPGSIGKAGPTRLRGYTDGHSNCDEIYIKVRNFRSCFNRWQNAVGVMINLEVNSYPYIFIDPRTILRIGSLVGLELVSPSLASPWCMMCWRLE